jgi:hypothetical protein
MVYDPKQAERLRRALTGRDHVREQPMFGGLCFMLCGHMLCGIGWQGFMFRVGKDREAAALARPGASVMELKGRRMAGFLWVDPEHCGGRALRDWIALAEGYIATLPPRNDTARRGRVRRTS